jgi:Adenylylsulfate kinase and related kinases
VYIECPIDICSKRDPKGLYARAKRGEINTLIGYNSNYIPPIKPDIIINTHKLSINDSINKLSSFLKLPPY